MRTGTVVVADNVGIFEGSEGVKQVRVSHDLACIVAYQIPSLREDGAGEWVKWIGSGENEKRCGM